MRRLSPILLTLGILNLAACAPQTDRPSSFGPEVLATSLSRGQTMQLEVTLNGRSVPAKDLKWSSSNPRVVSVSAQGVARADDTGEAAVKANQTSSGRTLAEFRMKVSAPPPVTPQRLDTLTRQVLELTNEVRSKKQTCGSQSYPPAPPLQAESRLGKAAQGHAANMADRDYFSHTSQDGRTLKDRVNATGYPWRSIAENIAAGQTGAQEVVTGWLNSEGHCHNLMNADYREIGIGLAQDKGGRRYWVQDFGSR
ncbi:CAP domain-containing protein [Deinococcus arenicola]|uniref:CAP domain-containing protein n=1 Tax=Deinococcus arenicola TaxID=2994950 RepID=A0ABU4DPG3_9DEIO|nr:CAP domain-containing protein [Deinococcus sp. ZS9-10]MDV6374295.1 CAP domain-containing protein [Deinococcus sp. ZS9-10]